MCLCAPIAYCYLLRSWITLQCYLACWQMEVMSHLRRWHLARCTTANKAATKPAGRLLLWRPSSENSTGV